MEDTAAAEPLVSSVAPCSHVRDVIDLLLTVYPPTWLARSQYYVRQFV